MSKKTRVDLCEWDAARDTPWRESAQNFWQLCFGEVSFLQVASWRRSSIKMMSSTPILSVDDVRRGSPGTHRPRIYRNDVCLGFFLIKKEDLQSFSCSFAAVFQTEEIRLYLYFDRHLTFLSAFTSISHSTWLWFYNAELMLQSLDFFLKTDLNCHLTLK